MKYAYKHGKIKLTMSHTPGKAEQNKKQKHDALMRTAFDLFSMKGIANTTIADIAEKAQVGKGTFYSYFKDKYDIRNHIIAHVSARIFMKAKLELNENKDAGKSVEEDIILLCDNIIDQLTEDKRTLSFISKNLSWGVFSTVLHNEEDTMGINFPSLFKESFDKSQVKYKDPLIMIYMIIELVNGTCYSSILYNEPLPIIELKPYLFDSIRAIMEKQEIRKETV